MLSLTEAGKSFVPKIEEKIYLPHLLFDDENIVDRIKNYPAVLWRIR